jgi:hypothetical protein
MTNRKRPVQIWPFKKEKNSQGNDVAVFEMPNGSDAYYIRFDTPEELRAAQFKARSMAQGIVRAAYPQAFAGLIGK